MKIDLVMWTKNGEKTLALVLHRINQVIPKEIINQKLIIDDQSIDGTREIAKALGWRVIENEGEGISDGANTALKHTQTELFASFEQDLLLSPKWWRIMKNHLPNGKVVASSGSRYADYPKYLHALELYDIHGMKSTVKLAKTLDNTIYKTEYLRSIGGFPKLKQGAGIDVILAERIKRDNLVWLVHPVASVHLKTGGLKQVCQRYRWYGKAEYEIDCLLKRNRFRRIIFSFAASGVLGGYYVLKLKQPELLYAYPFIRFSCLRGYTENN
jgi:glycosyltransferase involved in cell wall biosynthesis